MKMLRSATSLAPLSIAVAFASTALALLPAHAAPVILTEGVYTENFDAIATSGSVTNPVPGWEVRTSATADSLGSLMSPWPTPLRAWTHTSAQGKNVSSTNIASTSTQAEQNANTNRALGIRQASSGGYDSGAALSFNFATTGLTVQEIKLDLLMLNLTSRSTTFELQVGVGASPSSFTTLSSWSDPEAWGSTTVAFDRDDFGALLDGQSSVWFRFAALTPSTGSGSTYDLVALDNFSVTTSAVPEPSTYALLGIGALVAASIIRRRTARA